MLFSHSTPVRKVLHTELNRKKSNRSETVRGIETQTNNHIESQNNKQEQFKMRYSELISRSKRLVCRM